MHRFSVLLITAALCAACGDDPPTAPSQPPPYTGPIASETFRGTLAVGGTAFYSFYSPKDGPVTLTLADLQENGEPSGVAMGLSVGIPAGRGCSVASVVSATPGTSAHVNIVVAGGIYCARIDDLGNLGAPASFEINITHTQ